ncbi:MULTISPECIES: hypothetical protein [unclassified Streptomyces]|uniref:hypothetical protein n=1 Tax=unclassified Streptomyces TaxID=2593676 RepID=UPI0035E1E99E
MTDAPRLKLVRTSADLAAALRRVWEENGEPSSRQMEERAEVRSKEFGALTPEFEHVYAARVRVVDVVWKASS